MTYEVQIVAFEDDSVVKTLVYASERQAEKADDGITRQLNHEAYYTRVMPGWELSSSSDRRALDVVDGAGLLAGLGPHYSRRTPGAKTFTGVGQEIVLVTADGLSVWACVYQRTPAARGTGASRGRGTATDAKPRYIWRNMMFRNCGPHRSSDLIRTATERTYAEWQKRYGRLPDERLRTEIGIASVRSVNPGYCYQMAGWTKDRIVRGKLYMWAPERYPSNSDLK